MKPGLLWLLFFTLIPGGQAAEIKQLEVLHEDGHYRLYLHAELNATVKQVGQLITEYDQLHSINPYLLKSEILRQHANGDTDVHLVTRSCVFFICYEVVHDQRFGTLKNGVLRAEIVGEMNDFKSGSFRWEISSSGEQTRIIMLTEVAPSFVVPPMIGPYLLKQRLAEIALRTIENIERLAAGSQSGQ